MKLLQAINVVMKQPIIKVIATNQYNNETTNQFTSHTHQLIASLINLTFNIIFFKNI